MKIKIEKEIPSYFNLKYVNIHLFINPLIGSQGHFFWVCTSDCSSEWSMLYTIMHCLWFPFLLKSLNNLKTISKYCEYKILDSKKLLLPVWLNCCLSCAYFDSKLLSNLFFLSRLLKTFNLVFLEIITLFSHSCFIGLCNNSVA